MDGNDLTDRLRHLGSQPVPGAARADHTRRLAGVTPAGAGRRFGRLAVAAAALMGFAFGSTGLAVAGALPDPAQDVAHDVLSSVNITVPEGNRGSCVSEIARSDLTKDEKKAAKAACPAGGPPERPGAGAADDAPGRSGTAPGHSRTDKHADDPCRGKPPWAADKDLTAEEKAAMQAERAACPRDDEDTDEEPGG